VALAGGARRVTEQVDANETLGLRWFTVAEVEDLLLSGQIRDGLSLTGLLWALRWLERNPQGLVR
jgi:hypothetical protein